MPCLLRPTDLGQSWDLAIEARPLVLANWIRVSDQLVRFRFEFRIVDDILIPANRSPTAWRSVLSSSFSFFLGFQIVVHGMSGCIDYRWKASNVHCACVELSLW